MTKIKLKERWLVLPRRLRWSVIGGLLLLFYTIFGFFILPAIIRVQLETKLTGALHRQTTVAGVEFNPYTLQCEINGLRVRAGEGENNFIAFDSLRVNMQSTSLFRLAVIIKSISLINPSVNLALYKDLSWNFSDLLVSAGEKQGTKEKKSAGLLFSLNNIEITGGKIHFEDQVKDATHNITGLHLAVPYLSALPSDIEIFTQPALEAVINGTAIDMKGDTKPFHTSRRSEFNLNFTDIDLTDYLAYLPADFAFTVEQGLLDLNFSLDFMRDAAGKPAMTIMGAAALREVEIRDRTNQPLLSLPELRVELERINIISKEFHLSSILVNRPELWIDRRQNGAINPAAIFPPAEGPAEKKEDRATPVGTPLLFALKEAKIAEAVIHFTDHSIKHPARFILDDINFIANDISNGLDKKGRVSLDLRLNESATVKAGGGVGLTPLALNLDITIKELPFKTAQPYLDDRVNAIINSGTGGLTGNLSLIVQDDEPVVNFNGNINTRDFSLLDLKAEKLLSWNSFGARGLAITTTPPRITLDTLALEGLKSFITVGKDGGLNLADLAAKKGAASGENREDDSSGPDAGPLIEINRLKLVDNHLFFKDMQVSPAFNTSLEDIQGQVSGLSSNKDVPADIDLSAKLDHYSPLRITGRIHPWRNFYTDLTANLHDVELTAMSPYTIKYTGYPLSKGKLSLDLHYQIEDGKLTAANKAFIDQITLGEFTKNETATSLPVALAIALLKNRAGEINLDIPVSGELDDPEFSVTGVIFTVIKNLLVKAATAPFALLGSLFPDNRDFLFVEFAPGGPEFVGREDEKWSAFAKAMYDHPALKLEVTGFVDPRTDGNALRKNKFDHRLKARKFKDIAGRKGAPVQVDDVVIASGEYEKYLKKAYKAATFDRPHNFLGILKALPPEEMAKLIYEHIAVSDDDLIELGMARAKAIKDYLMEAGPIEAERIFLMPARKSRVDAELPPRRVEIVAR